MVTRQPVFGSVLLISLLVLLLAQFADRSVAATRPEDDFWTAPVLTGFSHEIDATILGATPTPELWWSDSGRPSVDLWWHCEMPVTGVLAARLEGLDPFEAQEWGLQIGVGGFPTSVAGLSQFGVTTLRTGTVAAGQTLHVRVRVLESKVATLRQPEFRLRLRVWPLPANRTLETAVLLTGPQFDHELDYAGAEPVWFRWVAPRTEWVRLAQSGREIRLSVSTVEALAGDPGRGAFYSTGGVTFSAEAGKSYWFGLTTAAPFWGTVESVRISLRPVVPEPGTEAANDARDRATLLTGDRWTLTGDTAFASGDPGFAQEVFAETRENAAGRDLWWQWGAPEDGDLVISREEPFFPVGLWIRRSGGTWAKWRWDFPRTQVVAGEVLEFAGDGERKMLGNGPLWDVAPGPFTFSGRFLPRPANDRWSAAEPLTGAEVNWSVPEDGAVAEPGSPVGAGRWWRWVPPRDGVAWCHFVEDSPMWSPPLARWFSGDSLDALVPVPPDWSPSFKTPHVASVKAGAIYWLWVPKNFVGRVELRLLGPVTNTAPESARVLTGTFNEVEQENLSTLGQAAHWFRWTAPATGTFVCRTVGAREPGIDPLPTVFSRLGLFRENDLGVTPYGEGVGVRPIFAEDRTRIWWALAVTAGETVWIRASVDDFAHQLGYPYSGLHRFETELVPFRLMPADSATNLTAGAHQPFRLEVLDEAKTNSIVRILGPDHIALGDGIPFAAKFHVSFPEWWETMPSEWNTFVTLATGDGRTLVAASPYLPVHPAGDAFSEPVRLGNWDNLCPLILLENATPDPGAPTELAPGVWLAWRSPLGGPADLSLNGTNLIATVFQGTNLSDLHMLVRMETTTAGVASNRLALDAGTELRVHVSGPAQSGPRQFGLSVEPPTVFPQGLPQPGKLRAGDTWEFHLSPPAGATPTPRVEFVADGVLVASLSASPWRLAWTNLSPGWHSIGARMIGAAGDIVEYPTLGFLVAVTNNSFSQRGELTGNTVPEGWWQWTAPNTGLFEATSWPKIEIYALREGQMGPSVPAVEVSNNLRPALRYPVESGRSYAIFNRSGPPAIPFRLLRLATSDLRHGAVAVAGTEPELLMPDLPGGLDDDDQRFPPPSCPELVQSFWWRWQVPTNGWLRFVPGPDLEGRCHEFSPLDSSDRSTESLADGRGRRWLVAQGEVITLRLLLPPMEPGALLGRLHVQPDGILKGVTLVDDHSADVVWHWYRDRETWLISSTSPGTQVWWPRVALISHDLDGPQVVTNRIRLPAGESARFFRIETVEDDDDDD